MDEFKAAQAAHAAEWKSQSATLPEEAKVAAPYINQDGRPVGLYDYCLPATYASHNLLPTVRDGAIALFDKLSIPWHSGISGGPGNHLLSSQVQCVNALYAMVDDPTRIQRAFGQYVAIDEVLEIEPCRFMTFEYIGPEDFFDEGRGGARTRGARCTSVDAAFRYRTPDGIVELALVEWKFTESYASKVTPRPGYNKTRDHRYRPAFEASYGSVRTDLVPLEALFDEPFYQLLRQQLLAQELERTGAEEAEVVRVLHVLDPANVAYQASLVSPELRALGSTVDEAWSQLLRRPDRFLHVDPAVFLDPGVTSADYAARYALGDRDAMAE
jgi:hypothetical protein